MNTLRSGYGKKHQCKTSLTKRHKYRVENDHILRPHAAVAINANFGSFTISDVNFL